MQPLWLLGSPVPARCCLLKVLALAHALLIPTWPKPNRLLLDSRVADVPMAYNPTFVMLSSLKPVFLNSRKKELCFSDHAGA